MLMGMSRFQQANIYDRAQLHRDAAADGLKPGTAYAGIVQIGDELCIFWNPFKKLYANRWINEPREFVYSGEGSTGPMGHTWGNRALIQAEDINRPVTVFYKLARAGSDWRCLGGFKVMENIPGVSVDERGTPRPDIRFRLVSLEAELIMTPLPKVAPPSAPKVPNEESLWLAMEKSFRKNGARRRRGKSQVIDKRQSDPMKTMYVLQRAIDFGGVCESCLTSPGWVGDDGRPHFQAHHVIGDVDLVDWIGAVCGTCHDRLHHGTDRSKRADELRELVRDRQIKRGRPTYELANLPTPTASAE
jgi:hypothetical protein